MDNRSLCLRYLMGDASPEEVATLSEWIAESPENAKAFALLSVQDAYMATAVANHCKPEAQDTLLLEELAALEQAAGPAQLVDLTDQVMARQQLAKQQKRSAKQDKRGEPLKSTRKEQVVLIVPKAVVWLGLAAAVALAATLLFYLTEPAGDSNQVASIPEQTTPEARPVFASIVRSLDAKWGDAGDSTYYLKQGAHTLTQGIVELELLSGTRVVVESPASFELTGINTMGVNNGRAVFVVPKTSASFILDTPSARFVKADAGLVSIHAQEMATGDATAPRFMHASIRPIVTEFGVHVDGNEHTHAQVFRGQIQVSTAHDHAQGIPLGESQAVVISADGIQDVAYDEFAFERGLTTTLQLVDMIMGGDGTTQRQDIGLHPVTGQYERNVAGNRSLIGLLSTGRLQPVPGSSYVTGTFVPSKDGELVGLPAGLTLPGMPETNGVGYGVIWSGHEMPPLDSNNLDSVSTNLPGYNFAGAGQQSLVMHTNAGVMIDLDSIRDANPGFEILGIKAVVGNSSWVIEENQADAARSAFYAYVDSDLAMQHTFVLAGADQPRVATLDLLIEAASRYLTLVSTDGGDGNHQDWIVLGNLIVVLEPIENLTDDF